MLIRFRYVLAVALVAGILSACGSSSSSSSSSNASSAPTTKLAGPAIPLGFICSCSGPEASAIGSTDKVIEAWAKYVNANAGINGHPVNVIVKDDAQNPATSLQDAKELVTQDHIMAMVGEESFVDSAWASYIAGAGIPVVGGINFEAPFVSNPDFYPSGTQVVVGTVGLAAMAKQLGKTHVGMLYCAESPVCAQLVPIGQGAAKLTGLKLTTAKISATAPSYTAPCLAAKSAGVDALFVADNTTVVQRVIAACVQQGYNPQQVGSTETASNAWLTNSVFNGALLQGSNANPFDPSTPSIKLFQDALNQYAPGLVGSSAFTYEDILPWSGGLLFQAAAKAAHITPSSTPADVKKGLYALKNETLGGVAPPLTFTPAKPAFIPCYFTEQVKGGKFASLNGNKPTCLTATQSTALAAAL